MSSIACRTKYFNSVGLPALPRMEDAKERRRSILVKWTDGVGDSARAVPGRILYLLEEQHLLGPKYEEAKLGDWNLIARTNKYVKLFKVYLCINVVVVVT